MRLSVKEICKRLDKAFPEAERRIIAVAREDLSAGNLPPLPLITVASKGLTVLSHNSAQRANAVINVNEEVLITIWRPVSRAGFISDKTGGLIKGSVSSGLGAANIPFWAYYDYYSDLNRVLKALLDNETGARFSLREVSVEADNMALTVNISLVQQAALTVCAAPSDDEESVAFEGSIR